MLESQRDARLLPLLVELQEALDQEMTLATLADRFGEMTLATLADRFGASPFHFHRVFASAVGETPREHVERLRIERAALLLATSDMSITELSMAVGFKNVETFSRRYKKALGCSPSAYRRMAKAAQVERLRRKDFFASDEYSLSRAQFVTLPSMHLLASRHIGDYGPLNESFGADDHPWSEHITWARDEDVPIDPVYVALFYDDPTMTPKPQQRCDVCMPLREPVRAPRPFRCMAFAGGDHAVAQYVGPVDRLLAAFQGLADEVRRSRAYEFREGAALEFLREPNTAGRAGMHRIDVCFPVSRRRLERTARNVKTEQRAPG